MKRFLTIALAGAVVLGLAGPVYANLCSTDVVPAATLLFPLVKYDYAAGLAGNDGETTLFAITNVSSEAQIVHITLWTDYSVAILDFNLTLTGYDVQTINIRDILRDGILPHDGNGANEWWNGFDPDDTPVSGPGSNAGPPPWDDGPYSTFNQLWGAALDGYFVANGLPDPEAAGPWDAVNGFVLDCDPSDWVSSPVNYDTAIPQGTLDIFQGYLESSQMNAMGYSGCGWSGTVTFPNGTWFTNQDPRATWMYVTADAVGACTKELPDGAIDYYNLGATTGLESDNVLIGDTIWLNSGENYSEADNAVHIEADPSVLGMTTPIFADAVINPDNKNLSFYARYHLTSGATFQDFREPLPTAWAFRYLVSEAASAKTWIRAWKGGTIFPIVDDIRGPDVVPVGALDGVYDPISGPNPAEIWANSCYAYTYYAWDEDENVNSVGPGFIPPWSGVEDPDPIPVPNLLPLETQEVDANEFFLVGTSGDYFGWLMFIWPQSNATGTTPGALDDYYQTWMGVKYAAFGQYTAALSGAVMANYNCDSGQTLPLLGLQLYSE